MISEVLRNVKRNYYKALYELEYLRTRAYPEFVFARYKETLDGDIPVFLFHSVSAGEFEQKLAYLVENEYRTMTADELYECLIGARNVPPRAVVLTFDDGLGSLWSVAYPLLKKYGLVGVAFIVPNWVKDGKEYYPNLEDYWKGGIGLRDIEIRDHTSCPLITWEEVEKMHESGNIDFQSHTLNHSVVFTSDVGVDFIRPNYDYDFCRGLLPLFHVDGKDNVHKRPDVGTPIYTMAPRMAGVRRYFDDEDLRDECSRYVNDNGGERFFKKGSWKKRLREVVARYKERNALYGRYESEGEMGEEILYELQQSKAMIERFLSKKVSHVCYPYFAGSRLAIELAKRSGYLGNFWGWDVSAIKLGKGRGKDPYGVGYSGDGCDWDVIKGRRTNKRGDDPYRIVRLPGDYVFRLPGKGRRSISQIMAMKCLRNLKKWRAYRGSP